MCIKCCSSAADSARRGSTPRDQCKVHKQSAVRVEYAPQSSLGSAIVPTRQSSPMEVAINPTLVNPPAPALPNPVASVTHVEPHTSQSNISLQPPRPSGRTKPLAQPLPDAWRQAWDGASKSRDAAKSLKVQRQEMEDKAKRTVDVVFYYAVSYSYILFDCS